jgi:hypothetical protein
MSSLSVGNLLLSIGVGPQGADDGVPAGSPAEEPAPASLDGSDGFTPIPAA